MNKHNIKFQRYRYIGFSPPQLSVHGQIDIALKTNLTEMDNLSNSDDGLILYLSIFFELSTKSKSYKHTGISF